MFGVPSGTRAAARSFGCSGSMTVATASFRPTAPNSRAEAGGSDQQPAARRLDLGAAGEVRAR